MRITHDKLIRLARREAERRGSSEGVIAGYVVGSVAAGNPLLGGTADIDLVLIHPSRPGRRREVIPLSPDVHLDIIHHSRGLYQRPRRLRTHPWLGPSMCEPIFLYDPRHFFEWAQASARGQFHRADHIWARANAFLIRARQTKRRLLEGDKWLSTYLKALLEGANAAVCLAGFPAAGRRMSLTIERSLQTLGHPEIYLDFNRLLGAVNSNHWEVPSLLSAWAKTFDAASRVSTDPELHQCRRDYYLCAFQELVEAGRPEAILWPLLSTWSQARQALGAAEMPIPNLELLNDTLKNTPLSERDRSVREGSLEDFLDHIEDVIEKWAEQNGV